MKLVCLTDSPKTKRLQVPHFLSYVATAYSWSSVSSSDDNRRGAFGHQSEASTAMYPRAQDRDKCSSPGLDSALCLITSGYLINSSRVAPSASEATAPDEATLRRRTRNLPLSPRRTNGRRTIAQSPFERYNHWRSEFRSARRDSRRFLTSRS